MIETGSQSVKELAEFDPFYHAGAYMTVFNVKCVWHLKQMVLLAKDLKDVKPRLHIHNSHNS